MKIEIDPTLDILQIDELALAREIQGAASALKTVIPYWGDLKALPAAGKKLFEYGVQGRLPFDLHADDYTSLVELCVISRGFSGYGQCEKLPMTETVIRAAITRYRIDGFVFSEDVDSTISLVVGAIEGCDPLSLSAEEAALIANMHVRAVKNAWRSEFLSKDALPLGDGVKWIKNRNGFIPTLPLKPGATLNDLGTISVPFASDGTHFSSACRMKQGYRVGNKGEETTFTDIEEALDYLRQMKRARWRRPNEKGLFGLVSAVEWREIPLEDLTPTLEV